VKERQKRKFHSQLKRTKHVEVLISTIRAMNRVENVELTTVTITATAKIMHSRGLIFQKP
jgi:hypothetical protein